jgi:hypothetical protein
VNRIFFPLICLLKSWCFLWSTKYGIFNVFNQFLFQILISFNMVRIILKLNGPEQVNAENTFQSNNIYTIYVQHFILI